MGLLEDVINNIKNWVNSLVDSAISGVKTWVHNVVDAAIAGIQQVTNYITENIYNTYQTFKEYVYNYVTNVYETINNTYQTFKEYVYNYVTNVYETINNTYQTFKEYVYNTYNTYKDYFTEYITNVYETINNVYNTVNEYINNTYETFVTNVYNTYHTTQEYITNIIGVTAAYVNNKIIDVKNYIDYKISRVDTIGFFKDAPGYIGRTITNVFAPPLLASLGGEPVSESPIIWYWKPPAAGRRNLVSGWIYEGIQSVWDGILKGLGYVAEMLIGAAQFVMDTVQPIITTLVTGFMDLLTGAITPGSPPKEIEIAAQVLSGTLYQRQVSLLDDVHHSPSTYEELFKVATQLSSSGIAAGASAMAAATAADQANPAKNPGFRPTVRELVYWSGIPAVTASIAVLPASVGLITPLRYFLNERWTPIVPPATDLIRFSVREVYLPERRDALIRYYPGGEYDRLLKKHGFKQDFREHYWMSHWVLASVGQLNAMLYRATWSRMAETGAFSPPAGAPAAFAGLDEYMWSREVRYNDLIPEAIPWLRDIIYKPYTRVDIRRMWDMRTVTRDEVKQNYLWLGYDDEHAEMMTIWTLSYTAASDIRALYARGHITSDEAQAMFVDVGVPEARAETFMKKLVTYSGPERTSTERDLTKTDILRMLKNGIFTASETVTFLQDIGYSLDEANYLVELYQYQPFIELRELTMSQILKSYRYEILTRDETKNALLEAGWSETAAETLLKLEDIKLADSQIERARERDLSRTDIIKSIGAAIITVETGYNYLGYLGYSDWEIRVIGALEGIEFPPVGG